MSKTSRHQKRGTSSSKALKAAPQLRLQALESRVLLDAAAAATAAQATDHAQAASAHAPDAANAELMQALEHANAPAAPVDAGNSAPRATEPASANVYFIDRSTPDAQILVKDLGPNAEVHFIEASQDGVHEMAQVLQGRTDIASVQILSHGSAGELHLGTAVINATTMQGEYRDELAAIGKSLSADGDILIYGCDFAAGDSGEHAAELLADITGADVAASTDKTGAESLGGNWQLEDRVGSIEADAVHAADWDHLLATPVINGGGTTVPIHQDSGSQMLTGLSVTPGIAGDNLMVLIQPLSDGTMDSAGAPGVTVTGGGTSTLRLEGSAAAVNALLAGANGGVRLTPAAGFTGFVNAQFNVYESAPDMSSAGMAASFLQFRVDAAPNDPRLNLDPNNSRGGANNANNESIYLAGTTLKSVNLADAADASASLVGSATSFKSLTITSGGVLDGTSEALTIGGAKVALGSTADVTVTVGGTTFLIHPTAAGKFTITNAAGGSAVIPPADMTALIRSITYSNAAGLNAHLGDRSFFLQASDGTNLSNTVVAKVSVDLDSDGDGIGNKTDLDDNGDGILDRDQNGPNLIKNGNFSGSTASGWYTGALPGKAGNVWDAYGYGNGTRGWESDQTGGLFAELNPGVGASPAGSMQSVVNELNTTTEAVYYKFEQPLAAAKYEYTFDLADRFTHGGMDGYEVSMYNVDTKTFGPVLAQGMISGLPSGGSSPDGQVFRTFSGTFTLPTTGNYVLAFRVTPNTGSTNDYLIDRVAMRQVVNPPVATDDVLGTNEDTPLTLNLTANDTDPDGDALKVGSINGVTLTGLAQTIAVPNGTVKIAADGSMSFVPAANYNGPIEFDYTVKDPGGLTDTGHVTIDVKPVNDPPVAGADKLGINEDTPVALDLLANDTDADGDALHIDSINGVLLTPGTAQDIAVPHGTVKVAADGSMSFVPAADYNGPVAFNYVVKDPSGAAATGNVTIDVKPVNDAPVAHDDSFVTDEDKPLLLDLVGNDADVDGDTLHVVSINGVDLTPGIKQSIDVPNGKIDIDVAGKMTFTPTRDYFGPVSFDYEVADPSGAKDTGSVNITVNSVNDVPVVRNPDGTPGDPATPIEASNTVTEDTSLVVPPKDGLLSTVIDADGDTVTIKDFTVDGVAGPILAGQPATIPGVGVLVIDPDGGYSFTPAKDYDGPVPDAHFTITDGKGGDSTGKLTLTITPVNDAPVAQDDQLTIKEDTPVVLDLLGNDSDVDGDTLKITSINGTPLTGGAQTVVVPNGKVDIAADGTLTFTPNRDYNGPISFDYEVTDPTGPAIKANVKIDVTPVNDVPVAKNPDGTPGDPGTPIKASNTVTEDTPLVVKPQDGLLSNVIDADGDTLTIKDFTVDGVDGPIKAGEPAVIPGVGVLVINPDGGYSFTPDQDYNGPVPDVHYTITDGNGGDSTGELTLKVAPVNDAPDVVNDFGTVIEDTPLVVPADKGLLSNDSDVEGDTLTIKDFTVDGMDGPITAGQPATIPGVGVLVINSDGSYSFTPAKDYSGPVPGIHYTAQDGNGGESTGDLTLTITPVNDVPVAKNPDGTPGDPGTPIEASNTVTEDTPLVVKPQDGLLSNVFDADGDTLTIKDFTVDGVDGPIKAGEPANIPGVGVLVINPDGGYSFTPDQDYNGPVPKVNYTITDGNGGDSTGELTLKVTPVNDAPDVVNDFGTVIEDTPLVVPADKGLLSNDSDVEGDTLTIKDFTIDGMDGPITAGQSATIPGVGVLVINSDGSYSFTPAKDYSGPVPGIHYTAQDGNGGESTGDLTLTITPVNDVPVILAPSGKTDQTAGNKPGASGDATAIVTEDTPLVVLPKDGLLSNVIDADGDTLDIKDFTVDGVDGPIKAGQPATIPGVGVLVINPDGGYTFTPAPDYNGPVPDVHYTVEDGKGGEVTGELVLTVKPVNDAPVANKDVVTTLEDTPVVLDLLGNDTDVDGDTLKIASINGTPLIGGAQDIAVPNGTVRIGNDGTITFVPAPDYNGPINFAYEVTDPSGAEATGNVSITVTPVNDAPQAVGETATSTNDHPIVAGPKDGLLPNDGDADGDTLTIKEFTVPGVPGPIGAGKPVEIPGVGTLNINADGSYSFTPNRNYSGDLSVVYTVSDGKGGLTNATLVLHVRQADDMYHDDYPFVFEPSDDLFGRHTGEWRDADGAIESPTGAPRLRVEGAVVDAVNGLQSLNGTQELTARGVVLQAVNAVDSLHGSSLESAQRTLGANPGSDVVGHVASDNALHTQLDAADGFTVEPRSITSLRVDGDVHLELVSHGQQTWIDVSDLAAPGHSAIQGVSATLADGKALPSWIRVDGHGHIAIERPVGADVLTLRIKVARASGQAQTHVIEIDSNAVEMRKVGESTKEKSGKSAKPAGKTASMTFADQLGHASKAPASVDAELMALLG